MKNYGREKYNYQDKKWGTAPITNLWTNFHGVELVFFHRISKEYHLGKKLKLLDLGCGGGAVAGYIKKEWPEWEIVGLDISHGAISLAQQNYPQVSFNQASADKLPFKDGYFDIVITLDALEHFEQIGQVLFEIKRVLKKDGLLFAAVPLEIQPPTLYWLLHKLKSKSMEKMDRMVGHITFFTDQSFRELVTGSGFIVKSRTFAYHLLFSIVNLGYGLFQIAVNKQVAFESGVSEMRAGLVKTALSLVRKVFSALFYLESTLFFWLPGGKGLYIFQKQ